MNNNNLLPKSEGEFSETAYWEKFFKSRSNSFEWYGEYLSLVDLFLKYVKVQDSVLVIGCGNSTLSEDIHLLHKCKHVVSIDTSLTAIKQMLKKNKKHISPLVKGSERIFDFLCMDASSASCYETITSVVPLTCVIDKGTTDAIHSGGASSAAVVESMWSAIENSLSQLGRYVLITLAQEHIVSGIVEYFTAEKKSHGWMINVHELAQSQDCHDSSFKLPVFAFVFYKMKPSPSLPLVYVEENSFSSTLKSSPKKLLKFPKTELSQWVSSRQRLAMLCSTIKEAGRHESEIDMISPTTGLTRYHCVLVKNSRSSTPTPLLFCLFIVPFGEHDNSQLYSGERARLSLCKDHMQCQLCLFVYLNPREYYPNQATIQDELQSLSLKLCPHDLPRDYSIPVLTNNNNSNGESSNIAINDHFIVETVARDCRRLIAPHFPRPVIMATRHLSRRDSLITAWITEATKTTTVDTVTMETNLVTKALYHGRPHCCEILDNRWTIVTSETAAANLFSNGRFTASSHDDTVLSSLALFDLIVCDLDGLSVTLESVFQLLKDSGMMILCSNNNNIDDGVIIIEGNRLSSLVRLKCDTIETFVAERTFFWILSKSPRDTSSFDVVLKNL